MSVLGTALWIVGVGMVLAGIAVGRSSPLGGGLLMLVGLALAVYTAGRDYDPSNLPWRR